MISNQSSSKSNSNMFLQCIVQLQRKLLNRITLGRRETENIDQMITISIDAHGLKLQWRGYLMFFAKIPRGGQGFHEKLSGGSPYFGFYCIFIDKCFEICLRGVLYLPYPLSPPHPPVCIYIAHGTYVI
jgi:hypothetical protein